MKINKEVWGKTPCGEEILLYTIENEKGAFVRLSILTRTANWLTWSSDIPIR